MSKFGYWLLGFFPGCLVGGYAIGRLCRKRHLTLMREAREEAEERIAEATREAPRALKTALGGSGEAKKNKEETEDVKIEIIDEKSGTKLKFDSPKDLFMHLYPMDFSMDALSNNEKFIDEMMEYYNKTDKIKTMDDLRNYILDHKKETDNHIPKNHDWDWQDDWEITDEDFKLQLEEEDNETITYYQQDNVLIGSDDRIIKDIPATVGKKLAVKLECTDKDFLYAENDEECKMYEIIVEHNQSYYRDIAASYLEDEEDE